MLFALYFEQEKCRNYCGYGPIAFIASVQSLGNLPQSLSSSGIHFIYMKNAAHLN